MDEIDKAKERIKKIQSQTNEIVGETFLKYESLIVSFNADSQMFDKGQDKKGSVIKPAYTPFTIKLKKEKGQPTNRVTLRDTGKFHDTLKVDVYKDYIEISSDVSYAKKLFKKYGEDILGMQDEILRDFVNQYVKPSIVENIKKQL